MSRSLPPARRRALTGLLLCALPLAMATALPLAVAQDGAAATPATPRVPNAARDQIRRLPLPVQATALQWSSVTVNTTGMRDIGRASPQPALAPVHALRGFKLQFQNGDHKLRRLGVLAEDRFVNFALADSNGDDPFLAHAELINLSAGQMAEVAGIGGGKFEIPLPAGPAGHVPVLAGFEFRRNDGSDANVRNIGVWLDAGRGVARVSLIDDQGLDLRGLTLAIGASIGGAALPGIVDWAAPIASLSAPITGGIIYNKAIENIYEGKRGYQVRVRYAWIPRAAVQTFGALAGSDRDMLEPSQWQRASRVDLLQGFEFTFMNSDHHLLGIAVNDLWPAAARTDSATTLPGMRPATPQPGLPQTRTQGTPPVAKGVTFQDNNKDDPVQWSYTYVTLRGDAR